jgi:hypothetical protein
VPLKAIKIKEIRFLKAVLFILVFGLLIPYLILAIESLFVTLNQRSLSRGKLATTQLDY